MKEEIKKIILQAVRAIPKSYLADAVVKETIRCVLFNFVRQQGLQPVPALRNPRFQEGPADMVGVDGEGRMIIAFCVNPTIALTDIKSLERIGCDKKFVISFSPNNKKVEMSTFFLKPGIEHIYIYEK
jgi:hypothetical protein